MMTTGDTAIRDRCTALAGIFQAARLVQQTSRAETRDAAATTTCINSIFNLDPETVAAVYGNPGNLHVGLEVLKSQLASNTGKRDLELTGYVLAMMQLERKLQRRSDLMNRIATGIIELKEKAEFFDPQDAAVIAGLADIYKGTVSTLTPRIMVKGDENVLNNASSQNMIRALLLAGVRATVLWGQCGGSRIKLIFQRKALLACCDRMLQDANQAV
jgi:high frequency lysogenization protein